MKVLLDTHTFLWFALNAAQLSQPARDAIANPTSELLVSPASYWEIAIKISIGKYKLSVPYDDFWRDAFDAYWLTTCHWSAPTADSTPMGSDESGDSIFY